MPALATWFSETCAPRFSGLVPGARESFLDSWRGFREEAGEGGRQRKRKELIKTEVMHPRQVQKLNLTPIPKGD